MRYEIANQHLWIQDPNLNIDIQEPFDVTVYTEECRRYSLDHHQKLHGPSLFFSKQGTLLSETWFYHGQVMGKARKFYQSGQIYQIEQYVAGVLTGEQISFYEEGSIKTETFYEDGRLHGTVKLFWPKSQLKRLTFYEKGSRHGSDLMYNEHGVLIDEGFYEFGQKVGIHQVWFPSGKVQKRIYYHAPTKFDEILWDEEGRVIYQGTHLEGNLFEEKKGHQVRKGTWDGKRVRFEK